MSFKTFAAALAASLTISVTGHAVARPVSQVDSLAGRPQSVGLVLSGGGAKGIAHIGVIQALEDNNIPIDYITGTSMGAIVGGLYAAGYTTDEMMDMLLSRGFSYWSTGKVDPRLTYYFARPEPAPSLFTIPVPLTKKDSVQQMRDAVPASIINPLPMNFAFMDLFAAYTAQCGGDFNKLFVPFRCVASDVAAGHKVVHSSGNLGDAIRTSMTFPIVFQPIEMNGALLYDGGIFDNFPVDVMGADFAPDILIGVDVSSSSSGPRTSLLDQVDDLVTRRQSYAVPADKGIKMRVKLDEFGLLDFPAAKRIYQVGYDRAMSMMDSIKARVTSRISKESRTVARTAFKARTPYVRFDSVDVSGSSPKQNRYLKYLFEPAHADTFGISHARESFYRAISPGRLQALEPHAVFNPENGLFTLKLRAVPKDDLSVSLGGYVSSSTNSYLYFGAEYSKMTFSTINASLQAWIGQSYMAAAFRGAINLPTSIPSAMVVQALVSRQRYFESDHLFFEDRLPAFIIGHEQYGRLGYEMAAGSRGKFSALVGYGHVSNSFYRTDVEKIADKVHRDKSSMHLGQIRLAYEGSTLNEVNFPTAGSEYSFVGMGLLGRLEYTPGDESMSFIKSNPRWIQFEARTRNYFDLSRHFSLGIESNAIISSRKLVGVYNADIVNAPQFCPTPASSNVFNYAFRANSYIAAGIVPVYKFNSSLSARTSLNAFVPMRRILAAADGTSRYSGWFNSAQFFAELDVCYTLPIPASVSAYVNYASAGTRPWSVGLTLGIFLQGHKFLH